MPLWLLEVGRELITSSSRRKSGLSFFWKMAELTSLGITNLSSCVVRSTVAGGLLLAGAGVFSLDCPLLLAGMFFSFCLGARAPAALACSMIWLVESWPPTMETLALGSASSSSSSPSPAVTTSPSLASGEMGLDFYFDCSPNLPYFQGIGSLAASIPHLQVIIEGKAFQREIKVYSQGLSKPL